MRFKADLCILITCLVCYILNQTFFKSLGILFFNNFFNDLLAVPLYFSIMNILFIYFHDKEITSLKVLFLITIILSFLGEYVAIYLRPGSTTDYLDVICYFIGMFVYYAIKKIDHSNNPIS